MEARPAQSVAGRCLDGPYPKGARKRRRCSTPDAPVTPGGSINPDHPDHSPPAAGSWGGGGASAALEVPPQAAPLFAPAPRPAWPSDDESQPPTVSAYLLRRDLGGLKFPSEASFERLLFHTDANWPVDVEERVAPRSGILFGPAAWAEIACSS